MTAVNWVLYNTKLSANVGFMPVKSLQGCLPTIAEVLDANRATLYERQRALVREGLLEAVQGHGRGSGVRATPESVAMLTIGMLASVSLADVGPLARSFSEAGSITSKCPLTGAKTFHAALSRIFSDDLIAERVNGITVRVNAGHAAIGFDGGTAELDMDFVLLKASLEGRGAKNVKLNPSPPISVFSTRKYQAKGLLVSVSIPRETVRELTAVTRTLLTSGDIS
jgi:hypothetical protein